MRYQLRHFWLNTLPMLYQPQGHVAEVEMECREVSAVDDLKVMYAQAGINDDGERVHVDYYQIKFHVSQADHVNAEALINPKWTGTKEPMLKRFWLAWNELRQPTVNPRLILRTNWPWDSICPLRAHLRSDERLKRAFFTCGAKTRVGKIRRDWQGICGAPSAEAFAGFLRALRFQTSALPLADTEAWLQDRCELAGTRVFSADWSAYDDLGMRLIETGRIHHTPERLRELLHQAELLVPPCQPRGCTVLLRSFRSLDPVAENEGQVVIDLCYLFEEREPRDAEVWTTTIPEWLRQATATMAGLSRPLEVKIQAHLSIAWFLGTLLPPKTGVAFTLRQLDSRMRAMVWDDSHPRCPEGGSGWSFSEEKLGQGEELAVALSVTHEVVVDVRHHLAAQPGAIGTLLHASLQPPGQHTIVDGSHGRWLVDALIKQLGALVSERRPPRLHLFPSAPVNLMVLLGQQAAVLGPTTVYEFEFGSSTRSYSAAMRT
jgi:hypothetical protein